MSVIGTALAPRMCWVHGLGSVIVSEETKMKRRSVLRLFPATFLVILLCGGPPPASAANRVWTGLGGDDAWSTPDNWMGSVPPTDADSVTFNINDSNNTNIVDRDFDISGLNYIGNGIHTTDFAGSSSLHVTGDCYIGHGGGADGADVTWTNGGTVTLGGPPYFRRLFIATHSAVGGTTTGSLLIDGPDVEADIGYLYIASTNSEGSADGRLVVGDNSRVRIGSTSSPTQVIIGEGIWPGSATGLLDASHGDVDLYSKELIVGYSPTTRSGVTATGTLRWDQSDPIHALAAYFGRGPNAQGILDVPAGGTFLLGTPTDPVRSLRIAWNDADRGLSTADLDFSVTDPTVEAHVADTLWIGVSSSSSDTATCQADGRLVLGDNSAVRVGTPSDMAASLMIGWSNSFYGTAAGATGLLDATHGDIDLYLNELTVGYNRGQNGGSATGTLRWDQPDPIHAGTVNFGLGTGAEGILDVPAGGTFLLGTPDDPIGTLRIASNNTGDGVASTTLDFTATDPTFEAFVDSYLGVGVNTSQYIAGRPEGRLVLGDNSKLHAGTPTDVAGFVYVGVNSSSEADSKAQGVLDASRGQMDLHTTHLYVGNNIYDSAGASTGTLTMGDGSVVTATEARVSRGPGTTGTLNLHGGRLGAERIVLGEGGTLGFTAGRLAVNFFNTYEDGGALEQQGGVLAPGFLTTHRAETSLPGRTEINGDYLLDSLGTLEIELFGTSAKTEYDQLVVNGLVDLDHDLAGGGILDLILNFGPEVGDDFLIIDNDGTDSVSGQFFGLGEGDRFSRIYMGSPYVFEITYYGHTGNDVVLTMIEITAIPAPGAALLVGVGSLWVGWLRRRRTL